ncbi:MAG TPA: histidine kinase dimerization/phosphoacceptor domain -containing protein [Reyranella sp.]|nr:histidine kinase dimerization/phosphoacceptor domain -containing protein [Reyranella sp.]
MAALTDYSGTAAAQDLALRLEQQGLVADFGRFALRTVDLQAILDKASRVAAAGLAARLAKVLQYLPDEQAFLVRSGVGWKRGVVGHAVIGGDSQSPAGHAFRTGEPVVSNDLSSELRFRTPRLLVDHGVRSAINVLVKEDGHSFGVLEVDSTHRTEFDGADVAFLQALANTLAAAIRAQQREDSLASALSEKETLLAQNQRLLKEKDLLIREVHHRVTNSLQIVHSALSIQAKLLQSSEARRQVQEAAGRVLAIGAVHRRLYRAGSVITADSAAYLRGLLEDMTLLLSASSDRKLELETEAFPLSADDLSHLGLIVVELITNAMKYGKGTVTVAVMRQADCVRIAVSDEGAGFPADFDPNAARGLGLKIVSSLANSDEGDAIVIDRSVPFGRILVTMKLSGASA